MENQIQKILYENCKLLIELVEKYRNTHIRDISIELNINKTVVERILNITVYHTYKISQIPLLKYNHKEQRLSFTHWYVKLKKQTTDVIWWSDYCWFKL